MSMEEPRTRLSAPRSGASKQPARASDQLAQTSAGGDERALTSGAVSGRERLYPIERAGASERERLQAARGQHRVDHVDLDTEGPDRSAGRPSHLGPPRKRFAASTSALALLDTWGDRVVRISSPGGFQHARALPRLGP
jgi:hypothetical protein